MKFLGHFKGLVAYSVLETVEGDDLPHASLILARKIQRTTPLQVVVDVDKGLIVIDQSNEYIVVTPYPTQEE